MERINFTTNWNGKLLTDCFTTIRLHKPERFYNGQCVEIYQASKKEKGKYVFLFNVTVVFVQTVTLEELTDDQCYLDTGYNKAQTVHIIETMYKNASIDIHKAKFDRVLLKRIKA